MIKRLESRVSVRDSEYQLHHWGNQAGEHKLIFLHGWLDCGANWQFLADALPSTLPLNWQGNWQCWAPDWRGFGASSHNRQHYWFADYLADLDTLLDQLVGEEKIHIVGHSMGANIASLYAGSRPDRLHSLALLEGFGLPDSKPDDAPKRMASWLDQLREPPTHKRYPTIETLAAKLQKRNTRLSDERALFIANHWAAEQSNGEWMLKADPRHKMRGPTLYRRAEALAFLKAIEAPTLWLEGSDSNFPDGFPEGDLEERRASIKNLQLKTIADSGHMLHHDQPADVAAALAEFWQQH